MALGFLLPGSGMLTALLRWFTAEPSVHQRLRSTAATPIADVADGTLVKVRGRVVLAEASCLESPLTGRRCAAYKFEIMTDRGAGREARPINVMDDQEAVEFAIEDETGRALVKAAGATLILARDAYDSARGTEASRSRDELLAKRYGVYRPAALGTGRYLQYQEAVLEPGQEITVLSHARWERDPDASNEAGYRDTPTRLVMETTDEERMIISDVT